MACYFGAGQVEYLVKYKSFFENYDDANLAHNLRDLRSASSIIITTNQVATHWEIYEQSEPTDAITVLNSVALANSDLMLAGPYTKPHGGNTLKSKIDHFVGVKYYPPPGTEYYDLLFISHKVQISSKTATTKTSQSTT
eukprot:47121-Ditylum_brightwellii.AAC.1